jgi:hypothetical protein
MELIDLFEKAEAELEEAVKCLKAVPKKEVDAKAAAYAAMVEAGAKVQILKSLLDCGVTLEELQDVVPPVEVPAPVVETPVKPKSKPKKKEAK